MVLCLIGAQVVDDFAWLEANVFAPNRADFPLVDFTADKWCRAVGTALSRGFFVK
jgi:hypothetical protein